MSSKERQNNIKGAELANMFKRISSREFGLVTRHKTSTPTSIIDGVSGDNNVAELWASKLKDLLNTNHNSSDDFSHYISGNISFAPYQS